MKKKLFPLLIALTALAVSASAAIYSVTGLSKLFAGAYTQVIIMAGSLEVAKLVTASLLYQYWDKLNRLIRVYFLGAVAVLMLITSIGIYGYLTAAYQQTANLAQNVEMQVELLENRKSNFVEQRDLYNREKTSLGENISQLQVGLAGNKITYTDQNGNLVTTTSSATRKSFEKQLDNTTQRQSTVNKKLDSINTQIFNLDNEIVKVKSSENLTGELGPLKYLAELTGAPMNKIINWLLLVIIFVFDPLAIALVVAANFAFNQARGKKDPILLSEKDAEVFLKEIEKPSKPNEKLKEAVKEYAKKKTIPEPEHKVGKKIKRIIERGAQRTKVMYEDGTTAWVVNSTDLEENKIIYMK